MIGCLVVIVMCVLEVIVNFFWCLYCIVGVEMELMVEIGCIRMVVCDVFDFELGCVVEFDCLVGVLVDIKFNGWIIVYGEVVVVD